MADIKAPKQVVRKNAPLKQMTAEEQIAYINRSLKYQTFSRPPKFWLKTGSKRLNAVLGSETLGIPYGKLITLAGMQSSGKTLLALRLLGKAQQDGAVIAWVDLENSFDADWAMLQGLDAGQEQGYGYSKVALFRTEFGLLGERGEERVETAEQLFTRVEKWMVLQRKINPDCKIALAVDSTTAVEPEEEQAAGLLDMNMRTKLAAASFLNKLTKDLMGRAMHTNAIIILISQLRENPAQMFGEKKYIPGGKGILLNSSVLCWMNRVKKGNILKNGRAIGLKSVIINKKNKMGGGSLEGQQCGVKAYFDSTPWEFVNADSLRREE